jgi:isopentenyl phosphate kinase
MTELVFLKLGGSLITDKTRPYTLRADVLESLAGQLAEARQADPSLALVLGHGSGSFGHVAAQTLKTDGKRNWQKNFAEIGYRAAALNQHVMDSLHRAGLPVVAFPVRAAAQTRGGKLHTWETSPLTRALAAGVVPVIFGDVVLDLEGGIAILSTEDLFAHLGAEITPQRILLAGLEEAVWADFPARQKKVERITPATYQAIRAGVGKSQGADVTGGMESKVEEMLALAQKIPGLSVQIFSGLPPGNLRRVLRGETPGSLITTDTKNE